MVIRSTGTYSVPVPVPRYLYTYSSVRVELLLLQYRYSSIDVYCNIDNTILEYGISIPVLICHTGTRVHSSSTRVACYYTCINTTILYIPVLEYGHIEIVLACYCNIYT